MSGNFCPQWKRDDSLESDCQAPFILCTLIAECATQRTRILGDQRLAWARSADVWRHSYGWISLRDLQHLLRHGDLALVASEKKRRRSSCHSSCCSSSWLPTSRTIAASLGTMPTTLVRRLMGSFAERRLWPPADFVYIAAVLAAPLFIRQITAQLPLAVALVYLGIQDQRHMAQAHHPGLLTEAQDLNEQAF